MKKTVMYALLVVALVFGLPGGTLAFERAEAPGAAAAPLVELGEPGTVFRYDQTYGEMGVPYLVDADHLYRPVGVSVDGSGNLWVMEGAGLRAMKYTGDGVFIMSIGTPGQSYLADETHFNGPYDVHVDNGGNAWVADTTAMRVVEYDAAGNYLTQLGVTWESGTDNDHFYFPISVASDSAGNIYVSDDANHRIQVFDSSLTYSTTLGVTGVPSTTIGYFNIPNRIFVDGSDYLYVADWGNHRVQVYDDGLNYVATLGESGVPGSDDSHFNGPTGVAVNATRIFVADNGNYRVQVFDRVTYAYVATLGAFGSGDYEFDAPRDVAVDAAGNLYVADHNNQRVQKFDSGLAYVRTFGVTGVPYLTDSNHYNQPNRVAVDADGNIGILEDEGRGHRFIMLDANGLPLFTIGEPGVPGGDNDHFNDARGVTFDADGNIYIGDCANHRVQIFDSTGVYSATLGSYGQGNDQFFCPTGVAFDGSGNFYVADELNQRIQVFDSSLVYSDTLGETGVSGSDDAHFYNPQDVAVDADGHIYVADLFNHRVQVFDSGHALLMTLGVTGECGYDFGYFCEPTGVAVDAAGNIYVVGKFGSRVQVFDASGAYLTTIGGSLGDLNGQMRGPLGVEVDAQGNVYVADLENHRVQRFAPGVPDWAQVNINGFGDPTAGVSALGAFNGQLYAGASNWNTGGQVWRLETDGSWTAVSEPGFGSVYTNTNPSVIDLTAFDGQLYATIGWPNLGQVWRAPDGETWEQVVTEGFSDTAGTGVTNLFEFGGQLYAGTGSQDGFQVWRSDSGDSGSWGNVVAGGLGYTQTAVTGFAEFQDYLYAATESLNYPAGMARVFRSADGETWTSVITDGFGIPANTSAGGFAIFQGQLYLGTHNDGGAQLWTTANGMDWTPVNQDGFGKPENYKIDSLYGTADALYVALDNSVTGLEIWRTADGLAWEMVMTGGLGDSNNTATLWSNATLLFEGHLYYGTWNWANGGEVWRYLPFIPQYDLALAPATDALTGTVGTVVTYTLTLTNLGNITDTFTFSYTGNAWAVTLPVTSTELAAGAAAEVIVTVAIPAGAPEGDFDAVTITAASAGDEALTAVSTLTTTAVVPGFELYLPIVVR